MQPPKNQHQILEKIRLNIVHKIYRMGFQILNTEQNFQMLHYILALIQLAQLLYVSFGFKVGWYWNNSAVTDAIFSFLRYTIISYNLKGLTFSQYLIVYYICYGFAIIQFVLMGIVSLQIQKKHLVVPAAILRSMLKISTTIGCLPFVGTYTSIMSCEQNSAGKNVMILVPTQQCWDSVHSIHAGFGIAGLIFYMGSTLVIQLINFEAKHISSNIYSQRSGRPMMYFNYFLFLTVILYQVLDAKKFKGLLLFMFLVSSFMFFYRIHTDRPFYNSKMQKTWSAISALNFWTILMLTFAALLEGPYFQQSIVGWIIGCPLIIGIVILTPDKEVDLLAANINLPQSGAEIIQLCEYLLKLIDESGNNRVSSMLLDGYIEVHRQTCPKPGCVLKQQYAVQQKQMRKTMHWDRTKTLYEVINQIYYPNLGMQYIAQELHQSQLFMQTYKNEYSTLNLNCYFNKCSLRSRATKSWRRQDQMLYTKYTGKQLIQVKGLHTKYQNQNKIMRSFIIYLQRYNQFSCCIYLSAIKLIGIGMIIRLQIDYFQQQGKSFLSSRYVVISYNTTGMSFSQYLIIFYLCYGFMIIQFILMGIVSLQIQKKHLVLPTAILRIMLKISATIGCGPLSGMYISIMSCQYNQSGKNVMVLVPTQQCWDSVHSIHAEFGIAGLIFFIIQTLVIQLINFEAKNIPSDIYCQRTGRPMLYYNYFLYLTIILYQILDAKKFKGLLLFMFLISSFMFFFRMHTDRPFYNSKMQKTWSAISALNFWTILMLTFAALLEGPYFQQSIVGWIIGCPLIIGIVILTPDKEVDLLAANINLPQSGAEIIQLCEYLLKLIDESGNNRVSSMLLDGYIEVHRQTCSRPGCVLKQQQAVQQKQMRKIMHWDRTKTLYEVINQIYYFGIKAFPQDVRLRINYAFFLMDRMKQNQQALTELQQAEFAGAAFDDSFIIYRYKAILETELQEEQQEYSQVDTLTELAFQNQTKSLNLLLEQSALYHITFWNMIQEDNPNIQQLQSAGYRILSCNNLVEQSWNQLHRLNYKSPKIMRLMAKYRMLIQNDQQASLKLIADSKRIIIENEIKLDDIANVSSGVIILYTDSDKLGIIQNVNKSLCSMSGYTKTDLINRKINILQPQLISQHHDRILENFIMNQNNVSTYTLQRVILFKNKANYLVPSFFQISTISTNSGMYLCGQIRQELQHQQQCYILCNANGIITNISSHCLKLIGIDLRLIQIRDINITEFLPDLMERKEEYLNPKGSLISFNTSLSRSKMSSQELDNSNVQIFQEAGQQQFLCFLEELKFHLSEQSPRKSVNGYTVKLVRIQEKIELGNIKRQPNKYYLRFNANLLAYQMDTRESNYVDLTSAVDQSIIWEDGSKSQESQMKAVMVSEQLQRKDLSEGIKTLRLMNDKIVDIDDIKTEQEEEEVANSIFSSQKEDEQEEQVGHDIQQKSQLKTLIDQSSAPQIVIKFKFIVDFLLLMILVITYIQYFIGDNLNQNVQNALPQLVRQNLLLGDMALINSYFQDLKFIQSNYSAYLLQKKPTFVSDTKTALTSLITSVQDSQNQLSLSSVSLSSTYSQYQQAHQSTSVQMFTINGQSSNYTFQDATQQLISKAFTVSNQDLTLYTGNNSDLYYFQYNFFNSYLINFQIESLYFYYNTVTQTDTQQLFLNIIISVSTVTIALNLLVLIFFLMTFQKLNEQVMVLFLELDEDQLKQLYQRCEKFITSLQFQDEDDNEEDDEIIEFLNQDEKKHKDKRRKRKIQYRFSQSKMIIPMVIFMCVFQTNYVVNYVLNQDLVSDIYNILPYANVSTISLDYFRIFDDSIRQAIYNQSFQISNNSPFLILNSSTVIMQTTDANIHILYTTAQSYIDSTYNSAYYNVYMSNVCTYLSAQISTFDENECVQASDGILTNGISIGVSKYLSTYLSIYSSFYADRNQTAALTYLNTDQAYFNRQFQMVYLSDSTKILANLLHTSVFDSFNNLSTKLTGLFIGFNIYIVVIYIFVYLPLLYKFIKNTIKIRYLLLVIPIEIIMKTRSIKGYIKNRIINY